MNTVDFCKGTPRSALGSLGEAAAWPLRVRQPEQEINQSLDMSDPFNTEGDWTAGFVYDVLGNVIRATDANGVNIINEHDKASRVTKRCYTKPNITLATSVDLCDEIPTGDRSTDTSTVENFYDGKGLDTTQTFAKGKLTKVKNDDSQTRYTEFDNFGRLKEMEQTTPVGDETFTNAPARVSKYTYNFSGALIEEEYPSGRKVKNEFESDGDLARIYGTANSTATERTYATSFSYTPDGRIARLKLGNGLWENAKFNSRLQVTELALGHGVESGDLWKLGYEYGELNGDGVTVDATKNTGNIAKQTLSFNGLAQPFVQAYKYDSLFRLTEAKETQNGAQTWKQVFDYDRYGNRLTHNKFLGTEQVTQTATTHPSIDPNKNRIDSPGYAFDKNGNLTTDGESRHFVFNADNKQTEVRDASNNLVGEYFYDGEGKRVRKKAYVGGVLDEETVFVYSNGKLIAEYSTKPPPSPPNATTNFTITDQLGSPRIIVDSVGAVVSRRDFQPFGEEIDADGTYRTTTQKYGQTDRVRQKFTGYQKDEETQLDFAEARMYENRHGRFTAVDPLLASGKSVDPQTFNRYVYVMNNPMVMTDPTGLQVASNVGSWFKSGTPDKGQRYKHPRFLRPDAQVPKGYGPMTPQDHVYYNSQRADAGELAAWTVLNPNRMDQENYETQEQATARLYELAPDWDPNQSSQVNQVGYLNAFVGFAFPQTFGFGPAAGAIYDLENRQFMPQVGIIWSKPGPTFNATYSPYSASSGLNGTVGVGFGRFGASGGVNQNGQAGSEFGASAPGPIAGVFYVYQPTRTAYFENSNSSEQSIENNRMRLGFTRPANTCVYFTCNSSTNTNSNTNPQ